MPSPTKRASKDPNEVKRYQINWNEGPNGQPGILQSLGNDTILTVTWVYPSGITGDQETFTTTTTTTRLTGGTAGTDYTITCRVTTALLETLEQSFIVPVVDKAI